MYKRLFTSESVTEGHPDKVADQISDAILDELLKQDPMSRVACETTCKTKYVGIMGEITSTATVDYKKIASDVIRDIGYTFDDAFHADHINYHIQLEEQSADIALGVDKALELKNGETDIYNTIGAGDQGMMFGYACDETAELMPMPISYSHKLAKRLTEVRKSGLLPYLRPDGKTQVTVEYIDGIPSRIEAIVVSSQHSEDINLESLRKDIKKHIIDYVIPSNLLDDNTKLFINPTGRFFIGGPQGDSGLTGRKIIVDSYGGYARHGGGAFSGKDPTKVDRSAAYAARHVAKNIVASKLAKKCEIQLAYAIGVAKPVSIMIDTFGTGIVSDSELEKAVAHIFDLRPAAIIDNYQLRRPIYRQLSAYGHVGREDIDISWEKIDKVAPLKKFFNK